MGSGPDYHVDDTDSVDSASNCQHTESQDSPNNGNNAASVPAAVLIPYLLWVKVSGSVCKDTELARPWCCHVVVYLARVSETRYDRYKTLIIERRL